MVTHEPTCELGSDVSLWACWFTIFNITSSCCFSHSIMCFVFCVISYKVGQSILDPLTLTVLKELEKEGILVNICKKPKRRGLSIINGETKWSIYKEHLHQMKKLSTKSNSLKHGHDEKPFNLVVGFSEVDFDENYS